MQKHKLSPKSEAIAYRAYIWARDREWDCTLAECAEALGVSVHTLSNIMRIKGWNGRFRANPETAYAKAKLYARMSASAPTHLANRPVLGRAQLKYLGVHVENEG